MTAITDSGPGPGQVIRWHYLAYSALALAVMTAAITSHERRFLNFVHVICGVLWTGIDLFMGFVIGPILRRVDITVRREMPALRRGHSGAATQSRPGDSCEAIAHAAAPCGASGRGAVEEPVLWLRRVKAARYQHSRSASRGSSDAKKARRVIDGATADQAVFGSRGCGLPDRHRGEPGRLGSTPRNVARRATAG